MSISHILWNGKSIIQFSFRYSRKLSKMGINNKNKIIRIDSTTHGIYEGLCAGCWTIGVAANSVRIGHLCGGSYGYGESTVTRINRTNKAKNILANTGAHYVVDDMTYLPEVIKNIDEIMASATR